MPTGGPSVCAPKPHESATVAEFVRFTGQSYINTNRIVAFDDEMVVLSDDDGYAPIELNTTCRDFQQYIDTKRHERVTYIGD